MGFEQGRLEAYISRRAALVEYASGITGDRSQAEDVVQEAFVRFQAADGVAPSRGSATGYLYRVVRNLALDLRRRRVVEARQEAGTPRWWMVPASPRTPEEEIAYMQALARVENVLSGLSDEVRVAVEMHRFSGYSLQEIASRLDLSVATVHRMIRDAMVKLANAHGPSRP